MNDTCLNPYVSNPALPFAIDTVGSADFYPAMLRLIGNEVAHDLLALARYTLLATAPNLGPTANGGGMPVRLIDSHGHELYKAPTWPDDPASGRAPRSRFALGSDFVLAPGGTIEYIPASNDPVSTEARVGLIGELTSREQDIVRLTLEGYPTIAIAKKLGLAVGTVKNHRTRIFRKLDITTERELFLSVYGEKSELVLR